MRLRNPSSDAAPAKAASAFTPRPKGPQPARQSRHSRVTWCGSGQVVPPDPAPGEPFHLFAFGCQGPVSGCRLRPGRVGRVRVLAALRCGPFHVKRTKLTCDSGSEWQRLIAAVRYRNSRHQPVPRSLQTSHPDTRSHDGRFCGGRRVSRETPCGVVAESAEFCSRPLAGACDLQTRALRGPPPSRARLAPPIATSLHSTGRS